MITEDYVSFEVAKLLKEKGFNEPCRAAYYKQLFNLSFTTTNNELNGESCAAPTLQMTLKWLREEKHLYIQVMLDSWALNSHSGYYVVIQRTDNDFELMLQDELDEVLYKTYEEAVKAAIKYCLENLMNK